MKEHQLAGQRSDRESVERWTETARLLNLVLPVGWLPLGVLSAAKERGVFGIGVDADQGYLGAHVMTSATKKVDVAVYGTIDAANKTRSKFRTNFNAIFTVANGGVGYGKLSTRAPAGVAAKLEAALAAIKAGKVSIPTTVK